MLQKEELKELLRNENYSEINKIFWNEYKSILFEFAKKMILIFLMPPIFLYY